MLVTRKFALVAAALLVGGCSPLPTQPDAARAAPTRLHTGVAASDTAGAGTTSSSGETGTQGGNLFGSGT